MSSTGSSFHFAKLCCGGNDFIVANCLSQALPDDLPAFVRAICDRREGAGADGIIFLISDDDLPFRTLLYNSDGGKAEVSYNGSRCVGMFVSRSGVVDAPVFAMNSDAGRVEIAVQGKNVILGVPAPKTSELGLKIKHAGEEIEAHFVIAGVPYLVLYVDDLTDSWVESVPAQLKTHEYFPEGTNVAVVKYDGSNIVNARFFERGVEDETPSSGSGSVAVAAITSALHGEDSPIVVRCTGGDFAIHFDKTEGNISNVRTAGEVHFVFEGAVADSFPGLR